VGRGANRDAAEWLEGANAEGREGGSRTPLEARKVTSLVAGIGLLGRMR